MYRLSHRDILAAIARAAPLLSANSGDRFMTTVSAADAFGLTLGVLLPLLSGAKLFVAPSASHSWKTVELIYDTDSTVVVTEHETLEAWTAWAEPRDFYRTRLCLTRECAPPMLRHAIDAVGLVGRLMSEAELNLLRPAEVVDHLSPESIG